VPKISKTADKFANHFTLPEAGDAMCSMTRHGEFDIVGKVHSLLRTLMGKLGGPNNSGLLALLRRVGISATQQSCEDILACGGDLQCDMH
jgi:hypothetical protein